VLFPVSTNLFGTDESSELFFHENCDTWRLHISVIALRC